MKKMYNSNTIQRLRQGAFCSLATLLLCATTAPAMAADASAASPASEMQQARTIEGVITDPAGTPGIGITVQLKGTNVATVSDVQGHYTLRIPANTQNPVLVFSFVGYKTLEMPIGTANKLDVNLEEDALAIEDVVITGYGTSKKGSYTGSAAVVKKDALEKVQVSSISKALQGLAPGVQANSASGQPGTDADIRIRGIGSVNASSSPLYVVDGVAYEGTLSSINPADIENITVLKDAASGALYGSRGANGVIVVTTKQGSREAAPILNVNFQQGWSDRAIKDYEKVSTAQYSEMYWEAMRNNQLGAGKTAEQAAVYASAGLVPALGINPFGTKYSQPVGLDGKLVEGAYALWDDDWVEALSQKAHRTDVQMSVSGGSKTSQYFISLGYLNDQGIALESGFQRYTGRINVSTDITKWLTIGANISLTHSIQNYPKSDDTTTSNVINTGRRMPSFYPVWQRNLDDGSYLLDANGEKQIDWGPYRSSAAGTNANLVGSMPWDLNQIKRDAATIRAYADVKFTKWLKFNTSVNADYNSRFDHYYTNPTYGPGKEYGGSASKSNSRLLSMTYKNLLTGQKDFGKHNIKGLIGQEYYTYNNSDMDGSRQGFGVNGLMEPSSASELVSFSGSSSDYKLLSYFANFEYGYDNKYLFSASIRTDGSSRFHPDNRWGTFWSVGGSWRAMQENFLKDAKWLSNATLRASYGAQGNDGLSSYYAYQDLFSIYNNLGESGLRASRMPTPDLKWESNLNLNIGLDLGFWENRLTFTVEYFDRRSKDLLYPMPMPNSSGFTSIDKNIGELKNYGWEFSIAGTIIKTQDWMWNLSLNATTYKNEIVSQPTDIMWSGSQKRVVGGSLYDFYMVEWAGVNPENGKAQWWVNKTDAKGNVVKDANGNIEREKSEKYPTNTNANDSRVFSGSALPKLAGGFSTTLNWKGVELYAMFSYSLGGKIYNSDKLSMLHGGTSVGVAWSTEMLDRWTPENKYTDVPALNTEFDYSWTSSSTRFLCDGDYLRLKNLMLSYNLPENWMKSIGLRGIKVFLQAENLLTLSKYEGFDPEQSVGGTTYYRYPAMKTFSIGLNVKL